jgi:anti-sigma factor RsiW
MANEALHDLTPAYALDALDEDERTEYERHLATCDRCRDELATMQATASALAYAVESPAPPDELRTRIVQQARAERGNVVPFRPRRTLNYALGAVAAAAATVAIAVGVWANGVADERDELRALVDPQAQVLELPSGNGRLHVAPDGEAALVVSSGPAPSGKAYEAWVIQDGEPRPAGLFEGGRRVVRLTRPVPPGASVAVTIEDDEGADSPTTKPLYVVSTRGS